MSLKSLVRSVAVFVEVKGNELAAAGKLRCLS